MENKVPVIRTERLTLAGILPSDDHDVFAYASDPEVAKNASWLPHASLEDSRSYISLMLSRTSCDPDNFYLCWAIRLHGQDHMVGTIDFIQSSPTQGRIDFALSRPHWNRGIITEAVNAVLNWAFTNASHLQVIESGGLTDNVGTRRVLEKCGMVVKRRFDYTVRKLGVVKEVTDFHISRKHWEEIREVEQNGLLSTRLSRASEA